MKSEKIKETIFVIGTYIFLLLFFYSFIDTNWSSEKLDYFNPYIGALGLLVVVGYIERSQTVLSKEKSRRHLFHTYLYTPSHYLISFRN